jgi:uncharacterized protein (DUF58 family)
VRKSTAVRTRVQQSPQKRLYTRLHRWLRHPLGLLVLAATISLVCGILVNPAGYAWSAALATIAVIGIVWPLVVVGTMRVELVYSQPRAVESETVPLQVIVTSFAPIPSVWRITDGKSFDVALNHRPWLGTRTYTTSWRAARRGRVSAESLTATCSFPFGFFRAKRRIRARGDLIVWPKRIRTELLPPVIERESLDSPVGMNRPGHGSEMLGLRPYRRGDPFRRIHWAATARQDQIIVREMQMHALTRVRLVVDCRKIAHAPEFVDSFDQLLRVAADLVTRWSGELAELRLSVGETEVWIQGERKLAAAMDVLATADLVDSELLPRPDTRSGPAECCVTLTTTKGAGADLALHASTTLIPLDAPAEAAGHCFLALAHSPNPKSRLSSDSGWPANERARGTSRGRYAGN